MKITLYFYFKTTALYSLALLLSHTQSNISSSHAETEPPPPIDRQPPPPTHAQRAVAASTCTRAKFDWSRLCRCPPNADFGDLHSRPYIEWPDAWLYDRCLHYTARQSCEPKIQIRWSRRAYVEQYHKITVRKIRPREPKRLSRRKFWKKRPKLCQRNFSKVEGERKF